MADEVLIRETVPRAGKTIDELLAGLRKTMTDNPSIQTIVLRAKQPFYVIEKLVPADQIPDQLSFHDAIRKMPMEEYAQENPQETPLEHVANIIQLISEENMYPSHIVCGNAVQFNKWMGLPRRNPNVLGIPVVLAQEIPAHVFIVCGAARRDANPEEVEMSIKSSIA